MKCTDVRSRLAAYLSGEMDQSEAALIRLHLKGCAGCSAELHALAGVKNRLAEHFRAQLSETRVPDHAWERIRTQIRKPNMNNNPSIRRRPGLGWSIAGAALALVAVAVVVFAAVPPVRAAVEAMLQRYTGQTESGLPVVAHAEFRPLYPAAVPERIGCSASLGMLSDTDPSTQNYMELRFFNKQEFIILYENVGLADTPLPEGEALDIAGHPAVLIRDQSGTAQLMSGQPQAGRELSGNGGGGGGGGCRGGAITPPERLDYTGANRLVWSQDGLRLDLLSNLPYEELIAAAGSLKPADPQP